MTAIAIQHRSIFQLGSCSAGSSEVARKLQSLVENTEASLRGSVLWDRLDDATIALEETYRECYEEGWDGYGAVPISQATYDEAMLFLKAVPSWLPVPEIVPEPDGGIGFEWGHGKNRILVASVDGTNRIAYAGLLGPGNKTHGTEVFDGSIPQALVVHISRIS